MSELLDHIEKAEDAANEGSREVLEVISKYVVVPDPNPALYVVMLEDVTDRTRDAIASRAVTIEELDVLPWHTKIRSAADAYTKRAEGLDEHFAGITDNRVEDEISAAGSARRVERRLRAATPLWGRGELEERIDDLFGSPD